MINPPNKCLFCLRTDRTFARQEHPIPESLGNDDLVLPPGYVCDSCNQYFGSKLEGKVLSLAPLSVARVTQAVKNKKAKYPRIRGPGLRMRSSGYWDRFYFASDPPHQNLLRLRGGGVALNPNWSDPSEFARFLLKMGLELLLPSGEVDPYAQQFNASRKCARFGDLSQHWDFAMGVYPDRQALVISHRVDQFGPLETRQIYSYGAGVMDSGDVMFTFMFDVFYFAVNLSRPSALEYIIGFNKRNSFSLKSRWNLFARTRGSIQAAFRS